jgi:hypothetical protein
MKKCFDYAIKCSTVYQNHPMRTRRKTKRKRTRENPSSRLVLTLRPIRLNLSSLHVRIHYRTFAPVHMNPRAVQGEQHLIELVFSTDPCQPCPELARFLELLLVSSGSGSLLLCELLGGLL